MVKTQENGVFGLFLNQTGAISRTYLTILVRHMHRIWRCTASELDKSKRIAPLAVLSVQHRSALQPNSGRAQAIDRPRPCSC